MKKCYKNLIYLQKEPKTKARRDRGWIYSIQLHPEDYSPGDKIKLWGGIILKVVKAERDLEDPEKGYYCIVPEKYSCYYTWKGHTEVCHRCYKNRLGIAFVKDE